MPLICFCKYCEIFWASSTVVPSFRCIDKKPLLPSMLNSDDTGSHINETCASPAASEGAPSFTVNIIVCYFGLWHGWSPQIFCLLTSSSKNFIIECIEIYEWLVFLPEVDSNRVDV